MVVTFGSTMGIEATYWEESSVLLGPSFYSGLGGTYEPGRVEEIRALLSRDLVPLDREAALMYGYYLASYGVPYVYYQPDGLLPGRYRGVDFDEERSRFTRLEAAVLKGEELIRRVRKVLRRSQRSASERKEPMV